MKKFLSSLLLPFRLRSTIQSTLYPLIYRVLYASILTCLCASTAMGADLLIGTATADITPKLPVALMGQFNLRIAHVAETPISANVVALESKEGGKSLDASIMVSCDLVYISSSLLTQVRAEIGRRLPGFDVDKIVLNATHTHTAPVLEDEEGESAFIYKIPKEGVTQVKTYKAFFVKQVSDAIEKAWNSRSLGSVTWGLHRAAVGYNRRAVYADSTAIMYGKTNLPEFRNLEGYEDHDINSMFFWNNAGKLIAMNIEVACPAQEFEHRSAVNADYWHLVRMALREKFGKDITILGLIGAAGDQSPHAMYRKAANERMQKLRNMTRIEDIADRIVSAVEKTYKAVKDDQHRDVPFVHKTEKIALPMRIITEEEYKEAKKMYDEAVSQIAADPKAADQQYLKMSWHGDVLDRYEKQKTNPHATYETEIHVMRIGDAAICTNQFELFTDYGIRIQARSKALQTFVVQLAGPGTYLPTDKAVRGGGYSAICQSNVVGPEGGQILVDRTLALMDSMWPDRK